MMKKTSALFVAMGVGLGVSTLDLAAQHMERILYNHPGLVVELGVGLCSLPKPIDYNGNGLTDLLVTAGQDVPDGFTYFFENTGRKENGIEIFKPGVRVGPKHEYFTPSYVDGELRILAFNREYDPRDLTRSWEIYPTPHVHRTAGRVRANQWSYVDLLGNGVLDLIVGVGDWTDYGWDDAFNEDGEWTAGPLRGFVYWIENRGSNDRPDYADPVKLETTEGVPIEVFGRPSPNFADFRGNGKLDLICGEFLDGFTFFKNVGTREEPRFAPGVRLKNGGEPIRMRGSIIRPTAYDWTGNGHVDLVVGAEDGSVALVRHTGALDADGVPVFEHPVYFRQEAFEVKGGVLVTPVSFDWNGNGREDLIAGTAAGHIFFFENLGGDPLKWAAPQKLKAGGETIRILAGDNGSIQGPAEAKWGYTVLSVADWNHNGLPDLVVNSIFGEIIWYENIGTRREPKLAAPQPVEVEWEGEAPKPPWNWWNPRGNQLVTQWRSSVQVIDLNGNGLNDLVALDQDGFLAFFECREIDGKLTLLPPKRIFFAEPGTESVLDHSQRPIPLANEEDWERLALPDQDGRLSFARRERIGPRWVFSVSDPIQRPLQPSVSSGKGNDLFPLRLNAAWAGAAGRRKFVLADWTGNGRLDLLVNSVNINLLENVAENPGEFVFRDRGRLDSLRLAGHTTCPTVVNWRGDNLPDLLVGAEDGYLYYMRNPFSLPPDVVVETADFLAEGRHCELGVFTDGAMAFANRNYPWQGVPERFEGWRFFRTHGGDRSFVRVTGRRAATVYFANSPAPPRVDLHGWEEVAGEESGLAYVAARPTRVSIYQRDIREGEILDIPQGNWSGGILLVPPE